MLTWGLLTNSIGPLHLKGFPGAARCLPQRHSAPCQMDHNPLQAQTVNITKWLPLFHVVSLVCTQSHTTG